MAKFEKGSKEYKESKEKAREALDRLTYNGDATAITQLRDGTVGHVEGPVGTWNTSGVELPQNAGMVRDVRPETSTPVSTEDLKELGVPVRDASDYTTKRPEAPADVAVESQDRTLEIPAAREAVEAEDKEAEKASKSKAEDKKEVK